MKDNRSKALVSATQLMAEADQPQLRLVDATWHMPDSGRDAQQEYHHAHIAGAVYFDIDRYAAPSHLPHMLPEPSVFADAVGALGIDERSRIVVYDSHGLFSAARVWWMFRHYGAADVRVLDGGLPAWLAAGGELSDQPVDVLPARFNIQTAAVQAADVDEVLRACREDTALILDARGAARFSGSEKEPREGLRSGHIPGSRSLPFTSLLDQGHLLDNDRLASLLDQYGINPDTQIISSCGSGVTAAIISLALYCIGIDNVKLYDGSWAEWGGRDDLPIDTA